MFLLLSCSNCRKYNLCPEKDSEPLLWKPRRKLGIREKQIILMLFDPGTNPKARKRECWGTRCSLQLGVELGGPCDLAEGSPSSVFALLTVHGPGSSWLYLLSPSFQSLQISTSVSIKKEKKNAQLELNTSLSREIVCWLGNPMFSN